MKNQESIKGTSLINFLLVIFRAIFFIYSVGLILYIPISIAFLTIDKLSYPQYLPVTFSFSVPGEISSFESESLGKFELYDATGSIFTESLPVVAMVTTMLVSVLRALCGLFVIKLICQILEAAKTGKFLVVKNAIRMRHMAYLFIGAFFIDKLNLVLSSYYLEDKLNYPGINFTSFNFYSFARLDDIFFYLFLLIIAEAFRVGAQMKQENDLTI